MLHALPPTSSRGGCWVASRRITRDSDISTPDGCGRVCAEDPRATRTKRCGNCRCARRWPSRSPRPGSGRRRTRGVRGTGLVEVGPERNDPRLVLLAHGGRPIGRWSAGRSLYLGDHWGPEWRPSERSASRWTVIKARYWLSRIVRRPRSTCHPRALPRIELGTVPRARSARRVPPWTCRVHRPPNLCRLPHPMRPSPLPHRDRADRKPLPALLPCVLPVRGLPGSRRRSRCHLF